MTHTDEPMTLDKAIASVEVRNEMRGDSGRYPSGEGWGHCYGVEGYWIPKKAWQTIDAELAKQREAEPVAWAVLQKSGNLLCCENEASARLTAKTYGYKLVPLYTHPQQRNAVEVISQREVQEMFHYRYETGELIRRDQRGNQLKGTEVGCNDTFGYKRIRIKGNLFKVHQIVWLYVYGIMPSMEIDHINGDRSDNRICNLRLATRDVQVQNRDPGIGESYGLRNIRLRESGTYEVEYRMFRKRHKVGNFTTLEDAQKALYEHKKANNHPDVTRDFIQPCQALSAAASRDREDAEQTMPAKAVIDGVTLMTKVGNEYQSAVADIFDLRKDGPPYNERDCMKDSEAMYAFQRLNDAGVRFRTVMGEVTRAIDVVRRESKP
jgi:hypothetical protein